MTNNTSQIVAQSLQKAAAVPAPAPAPAPAAPALNESEVRNWDVIVKLSQKDASGKSVTTDLDKKQVQQSIADFKADGFEMDSFTQAGRTKISMKGVVPADNGTIYITAYIAAPRVKEDAVSKYLSA